MIDLKPYGVFAEVVAAGSMSAAARRLGMTPSAVSQIVGNLEREMGVRLFHRSTRKLTLTEAGARCYPYSLRMMDAGRAAAASLEEARDAPSGELRISAPVGFGAHVAPALAPILVEWPQLRLRLIVDDALIDLVENRIDIALRVGWSDDGVREVHALGDLTQILCAAPAYLERRDTIGTPSDLAVHHWLALRREGNDVETEGASSTEMAMSDGTGALRKVTVPLRITTTNQIALQQMCEQGMGIARLFYVDARPALERGVLTRVLPLWRLPAQPLTMTLPRRSSEPAKSRVARLALFALLRRPSPRVTTTTIRLVAERFINSDLLVEAGPYWLLPKPKAKEGSESGTVLIDKIQA